MSLPLALAAVAAVVTTLLLILGLLRWAPRLGLLDRPNSRSSHLHARARGGGAAIVVGVLAGCGALAWMGATFTPRVVAVLAAAVVLAALGLWDDLAALGAPLRLAVQCAVAVAIVASLGGFSELPLPPPANVGLPPLLGAALAVLWLVAVTNFFNFMDGIDGLAGGQALVTALALVAARGVAAGSSLLLLLAATLVVFLVFNWAPSRLFLGDVGSGFLGFLLAASPWLGAPELRTSNLLLVATTLALFLLDPLWTLAVRWRRGARLTEAHREHLYQRFTGAGRGHAPAAAALLAAAMLLATLAVWSFGDADRGWWALGGALLLFAVELGVDFAVARR